MDGEYLPNIKDEPGFLSRLENTDVFLVCKNKNKLCNYRLQYRTETS